MDTVKLLHGIFVLSENHTVTVGLCLFTGFKVFPDTWLNLWPLAERAIYSDHLEVDASVA